MPSPLGRVPPKGAGEVRYNIIIRNTLANGYCGNTSSTASGPPSPKGKARAFGAVIKIPHLSMWDHFIRFS